MKPLSASVPKADKGLEDEEKSAVKPYKEDPFQGRHTNDGKAYAGGAFGGGGTGGSWGSESDSLLTNWRSSLV